MFPKSRPVHLIGAHRPLGLRHRDVPEGEPGVTTPSTLKEIPLLCARQACGAQTVEDSTHPDLQEGLGQRGKRSTSALGAGESCFCGTD